MMNNNRRYTNNLVTGEALFSGENIDLENALYVYPITSPIACGRYKSLKIKKKKGFVKLLTAKDIPGSNGIGAISRIEEPLFSKEELNYVGQPIACVIATSLKVAREIAKSAIIEVEEEKPVFTISDAMKNDSYYSTPLKIKNGDYDKELEKATHILRGISRTKAQEHAYIETNRAYVTVGEHGQGYKVYCATQGISDVQDVIASLLGISNSLVEVDVMRVGGAFGGKERGGTMWASMTALACYYTNKTCAIELERRDDISITGKRHPFEIEYEVGIDDNGKILCSKLDIRANGGYYEDFTVAIIERAMLGIDGCYNLGIVDITGRSCRTNYHANTAFRGFGAPQATVAIERIMNHIAHTVKKDIIDIQKLNFYKENDYSPCGQHLTEIASFMLEEKIRKDYDERVNRIKEFNHKNKYKKRGLGIVFIKYGIGFTATFLNQANALVYVYQDGSVSVSHGGIEMGQGLYAKVARVVSKTLGIKEERITCESTNSKRCGAVASTAASTGSDLNGWAAKIACDQILVEMKEAAKNMLKSTFNIEAKIKNIVFKNDYIYEKSNKDKKINFSDLASYCYFNRYKLGAQGHYATPNLYYDMIKGKGNPFAYFTSGACLTEVEIDLLTGSHTLLDLNIIHQCGKILDYGIDRGQIIGGFMQGYGFATMEEVDYSDKGVLLSNSLSTYKVPLCDDFPKNINIEIIEDNLKGSSIFGSKGVGEPPLLYGISTFNAITNALESICNYKYISKLNHPATSNAIAMEAERLKNIK